MSCGGPGTASDLALAEALAPLAGALDKNVSHIVVLAGVRSLGEFRAAVEAVTRARPPDRWDESEAPGQATRGTTFSRGPRTTSRMLAELGFITEDEEKTHGDLPDEIVEAVRALELDAQYLTASLRGYQSFAARFALVQRKVIIGDEMGLGKTVEALAVVAHLRAKGFHHALVVCPAAVVTNWVREVASKTGLRAHRLHGPDRAGAAKDWIRHGGVAVTTFDTLRWYRAEIVPPEVGCVIVDEAHYIKNPDTQRTMRTTEPDQRVRVGPPAHRNSAGEPDRRVPQPGRLPATRPRCRHRRTVAAQVPAAGGTGLPAPKPGRCAYRTPGPCRSVGVVAHAGPR